MFSLIYVSPICIISATARQDLLNSFLDSLEKMLTLSHIENLGQLSSYDEYGKIITHQCPC